MQLLYSGVGPGSAEGLDYYLENKKEKQNRIKNKNKKSIKSINESKNKNGWKNQDKYKNKEN